MGPGDLVDACVVGAFEYGLYLEAGGITGFVQPTEVSWNAGVSPTPFASW